MGKFDLDDILHDLDSSDAKPPTPVTKPPSAEAAASDKLFVRQNPSEIPRPPDLTGTGLGQECDTQIAATTADPSRLRPDQSLTEIYNPTEAQPGLRADLARVLLERSILSAEQMATVERIRQQAPGKPVIQIISEIGGDEVAVQQVVAELGRLPFERVETEEHCHLVAINKLGAEFCRDRQVLPLRMEGGRIVVGTARADDVFLLDEVKRKLGVPLVKHVLLVSSDILNVIEKLNEADAGEYDVDEILAGVEEDDVEVVREIEQDVDLEDVESAPVVRYVNHIIQTAMKEGASDIHIEPEEKTMAVRFRIDGLLYEMMNPPKKMHAALTSRIKIMANLDIAERRLPQDGRIRATVLGRKLDLRVSTLPTPKGEKTVMRILDNKSIQVSMEDLGFSEDTHTIWANQVASPHGIILVTGPTGSGKTTTLYSSLRQMDLRKLNVSTVEDPVEYNLKGITQVQVHPKINLNFSTALKALMRQDPDVIMVGEIRDMDTATIAIQAALTGHLVLSTLHTNDAPASITRLINIGVEPFLVGAAVNAVLAQRLVRHICANCSTTLTPTEEMAEFLALQGIDKKKVQTGKGCSKCRETGYSGRLGIFELLVLDDHIRDAIAGSPNVTQFRRMCSERGMVTLREDGFTKVADGLTSVEEVLRVTEATI